MTNNIIGKYRYEALMYDLELNSKENSLSDLDFYNLNKMSVEEAMIKVTKYKKLHNRKKELSVSAYNYLVKINEKSPSEKYRSNLSLKIIKLFNRRNKLF